MLQRRIASESDTARLVARLRELLAERCTTSLSEREHHGRGESYHPTLLPDAVCYPLSTEEVAAVVGLCNEHRVPVVAFGAGTSLEGHVTALAGGVSVDMRRMDAVLAVHPEDLDASVQAGVTRKALNAHLRATGLFFAIDPGADATLGGMAATRASGTAAVRYGTMRDNVMGLTVVLADGRIVRTGGRARKSSAGYDLTRLFVGSEGTLGLITEVTVRLHGVPEAVSAGVCAFPDVPSAIRTAIETIQSGIPVGRMEFLDARAVAAVNRHSGLALAELPTLFLEFAGTPASVAEQAESVRELALGNGGRDWSQATAADGRARLWHARHEFHYAMQALRPGGTIWATDACVPVSRMAECIAQSCADAADAPFPTAAVGHVGDGNFHMSYVIDIADPNEIAAVERLNARLIERTLAMGGTSTGEHGVGYGKSKYLVAEHGEAAVDVMRAIKGVLDPNGILNPGKVLPG